MMDGKKRSGWLGKSRLSRQKNKSFIILISHDIFPSLVPSPTECSVVGTDWSCYLWKRNGVKLRVSYSTPHPQSKVLITTLLKSVISPPNWLISS
jgi:hypothetical protein